MTWPEFISDAAMAFLTFGLLARELVMRFVKDKKYGSDDANRRRDALRTIADVSFVPILTAALVAYVIGLILQKLAPPSA